MNCIIHIYESIRAKHLLSKAIIAEAKEIITNLGYYKQTGRPPIDPEFVLQAVYYIARTEIPWGALPKCFGPISTLHAAFQRLHDLGFFDNFWLALLEKYDKK
ncbi:MAG TPA: transposase [Candidatus Bathyarchaeia archaeon]|nr:transposase [Candidatus Bathyarchaeia archaeon]